MQVQSATDPPKKLALGERAVMADGNEYIMLQLKEKGEPIEIVYPTEGTPLIVGPNAIFKTAPNPNAARLLQSLDVHAGMPAAHHRHRRRCARCIRRPRKSRAASRSQDQADEGRRGRGREAGRGSRSATARSSGSERDPSARRRAMKLPKISTARRPQGIGRAGRRHVRSVGQGAGRRRRRPRRSRRR